MALTPAEVHNVAFKKPPIGKRGYDEEEVDAFLDIVEVELARLIEENNDLKSRAASGGAPAPAQAGDGGQSAAALAAAQNELKSAREDNQRMQSHIAELEKTMSQGKDGAQQQVVQLQQQLQASEQQLADAKRQLAEQAQAPQGGSSDVNAAEHHAKAVQVLALAQQTADQHLSQSQAEAERLVNEAQSTAQSQLGEAQQRAGQMVSEAEARAKQLDADSSARAAQTVRDAEQRAATITAQFEQRKSALERRVEELRVYEREYRTRLRSYLESQLRDLDASGKVEGSGNEGENAEGQQG